MQRWTGTGLALLAALAMTAAACGSDTTTTATTTGTSDASGGEMADEDGEEDGAMDDDGEEDGAMDDDGEERGDDDQDDDHDDDDHSSANLLDIAVGSPVPSVSIAVDDLLLTVSVDNFTITPENIDGEPVENEGHMHLLVDGVKVDRFTELERDLRDVLEPGMRSVEVELNANDHRAWAVDGERIRDSVMVDVPGAIEETAFVISATYRDGTVEIAEDRVEVPFESEVLIQVTSDVAEELHVHGYDVYAEIDPDTGGQVRFTADIPGTFEVELEQSGTFIVELIVRAT